ncbi:MAG: hypothetical protein G01um101470_517 [Parcubacteria group bacterium Gr01-1014_70]|nr:MAG: hypothetical protein G01um101470_517 [Parcubacteria group bacterium Gr01-1014_70]
MNENTHSGQEIISELRQDFVSGEWVLLATGRAKRPQDFIKHDGKEIITTQLLNDCPFEHAHINNKDPLLWYATPGTAEKDTIENWFLQVVPNKYPALVPHPEGTCPSRIQKGPLTFMPGIGYHEVIITRPHERGLGEMTSEEAGVVIQAYRERYVSIKSDPCVSYILIFHNHGKDAGASISHPHSQLIAFPIIPPDVKRSFWGSQRFYNEHKKCVHCQVLAWELEVRERIVYENDRFVAVAPYASHVSFEVRIFPKEHNPYFELITEKDILHLSDALVSVLGKFHKALEDPAYNFFIHTAPVNRAGVEHYHWHLEILPKTSVIAGLELGTGVDVVVVAPEDVPKLLG